MVSELFRAFQRFLEVFRGFQRFSEVLRGFQRFFKGPLRDPLRVPFSSQSCGSCCPQSCCPLKLLQLTEYPSLRSGDTPWDTPSVPPIFRGHSAGHSPGHFGPKPERLLFRESETTIKIKFALFRGAWALIQGGKLSTTLFFMGNVMTIKFWKWKLYCRDILLSWRRVLPVAGRGGASRNTLVSSCAIPGSWGEAALPLGARGGRCSDDLLLWRERLRGFELHKDKLFSLDFLQTFLTLTPGCPGVQKLQPVTDAAEKDTLGADVHDCWGRTHDPKGFL